jgi:hypothetical protein
MPVANETPNPVRPMMIHREPKSQFPSIAARTPKMRVAIDAGMKRRGESHSASSFWLASRSRSPERSVRSSSAKYVVAAPTQMIAEMMCRRSSSS